MEVRSYPSLQTRVLTAESAFVLMKLAVILSMILIGCKEPNPDVRNPSMEIFKPPPRPATLKV